MGRRGQRWHTGSRGRFWVDNTSFSGFVVRAQNITTTAHFVGLGRVQALSRCRDHILHAHNVRSDIRFGPWRRCSHLCSHLLGSRGVNTGVNTYRGPGVGHTVVSTCQHIVLNSRFRIRLSIPTTTSHLEPTR